tara:strand:+ start:223906 stop:224202 length:297 start_codon:yes stop_codon:yes gene_type:complete
MKKLFLYLLRKYSKTENGRLEILKELDDGVYYNYNEQTSFGNVYNYFIEFMMSNPFVYSRVVKKDTESLEILKKGINTAFDESIEIIKGDLKYRTNKK